MSGSPRVPSGSLREAAQQEARQLLADTAGVRAIVVATTDGFDIASAGLGRVDPSRIAALCSSIAAIGDVVSTEAELGRIATVTVNTSDGFALAQTVPRPDTPLVIMVVAGSETVLAQAQYRAAAAARTLLAA